MDKIVVLGLCFLLQIILKGDATVVVVGAEKPVEEYLGTELCCRVTEGYLVNISRLVYSWSFKPAYINRGYQLIGELSKGRTLLDGGYCLKQEDNQTYAEMAGHYRCTVSGAGLVEIGESLLTVYYAAKTDEVTTYTYVHDLHTSATLKKRFTMNPPSLNQIHWSLHNEVIDKTDTFVELIDGEVVEVSYLILNVSTEHLGVYDITVINGAILQGQNYTIFHIDLRLSGPPEKPKNVSVFSIFGVIRVSWIAGLDGGFPQDFLVQYKEEGETTFRNYTKEANVKRGEKTEVVVAGITQTEYSVRVLAVNEKGEAMGDIIPIKIPIFTFLNVFFQIRFYKKGGLTVYLVTGMIAALICAVGLAVMVILLKRHRKKVSKKKRKSDQDYTNNNATVLTAESHLMQHNVSPEIVVLTECEQLTSVRPLTPSSAHSIVTVETPLNQQHVNPEIVALTESKQLTNMRQQEIAKPDTANRGRDYLPTALSEHGVNKFDIEDVKLDRSKHNILGHGAYGHVYKGSVYGTDVAIKEVPMKGKNKHDIDPVLVNEVLVSHTIRHESVVNFMGYALDLNSNYRCLLIIYEYINGDSLEDIIDSDELKDRYKFDESRKYSVLCTVCETLTFLHEGTQSIIHGDVKPANIMLTNNGQVKLCDLGVSRIRKNTGLTTTLGEACGTPLYMAPEQLLNDSTSTVKTDVYGFGATMYEVMFEQYMWDVDESVQNMWDVDESVESDLVVALKRQMEIERIPPCLNEKGDPSIDLIRHCVHFEPSQRPTARSVLEELKKLQKLHEQ